MVLAFQESGVHANAYGTALFIAPLVVGSASVVLLACWETFINRSFRHTVSAIFPSSLMKRRVYTAGALTTLLTGFPYFVVIYNTPLHFQVVNGKNSLTAGVGLVPLLASTATGSMLSGAISGKKNLLFHTLMVGSCLLTLGCGLLSTISGGVSVDPKIYGFQVLVGLGFGLIVSTSSMIAVVECELKDHGNVSSPELTFVFELMNRNSCGPRNHRSSPCSGG